MNKHTSLQPAWITYSLQGLAAMGTFLLVGAVLRNPPLRDVLRSSTQELRCSQPGQADKDVSRDQIAKLANLQSQQTRADVQALLGEPYCYVSSVKLPGGEDATGDVYPLAFDPQTWIVMLYSQDMYIGYQFEFK